MDKTARVNRTDPNKICRGCPKKEEREGGREGKEKETENVDERGC